MFPGVGSYNDKFMALGGGGFVGSVSAPTNAVKLGYAGAATDTGHVGGSGSFGVRDFELNAMNYALKMMDFVLKMMEFAPKCEDGSRHRRPGRRPAD